MMEDVGTQRNKAENHKGQEVRSKPPISNARTKTKWQVEQACLDRIYIEPDFIISVAMHERSWSSQDNRWEFWKVVKTQPHDT